MNLRAPSNRRNKDKRPRAANGGWLRRTLLFTIKWTFVLGVWGLLGVIGIMAWYARELPDITRSPQFTRKPSITVKANDGSVIARYGDIKGDSLTIKELPPTLIEAVLATEDRRFYHHFGVDPIGLTRAIVVNMTRGGVIQGGSTITQQLAKNLFLTQERTFKRKVQEALLALWLEKELTKDEILATYLNRVYMGAGTYGVDAASQIYFQKSARDLTLRESAILAGLLKAPSKYSPRANPLQAEARADQVIYNMKSAGYLSDKQQKQANALPMPRRKPVANDSSQYFGDWVVEQLDDLIGSQEKDIVIETTMDPEIQKAANDNLNRILTAEGEVRKISQGAVLVMRRDGAVLAMVGGRDYTASQFNRATHALRPPGSSFKPIVYLAALENGWTPDMLIEDMPITEGKYRPTNFDGSYYGPVPLSTALALSLNTAAVRLMQSVGVDAVIDTARRLGITANLEPNLSTALGSNGTTQIEMASAFAVMANGGLAALPYGIINITNIDGHILYQRDEKQDTQRVFSFSTISVLNEMLAGVVQYGTGTGANLGIFTAGKTGTSQDYRDAWFTGFTNSYVASVWLGNDDNSSMKRVTGGSLPAHIWRETIEVANSDPTPAPDHAPRADSGAFSSLLGRILSIPQEPIEPEPEPGTAIRTDNNADWWGVSAGGLLQGTAARHGTPGNHNDPQRYND